MRFNIIFKTSRSITVELDNQDIYYAKKPFDVYINHQMVLNNHTRNVFSIYDLKPETSYEITVKDTLTKMETTEVFTTEYELLTINVKDCGAVGDGIHEDTTAIQTAIHACPPRGRVFIPKGTYKVAPLFLKSDILIELEKGTTLLYVTDRDKYGILPGLIPLSDGSDEYHLGNWEGNPGPLYASPITGINVTNVSIIGEAVIDCNAQQGDWWKDVKVMRGAWRPNGVFLIRCDGVNMQGVTVQNTASWNLHPYFSKNIRFLDMKLFSPKDSPNTDGCDPESCNGVDIIGVDFSVGDDCIAIKAGKLYLGQKYKEPSQNFLIRNCLMAYGHGAVVFGSETGGGIKNITTERCIFKQTDRGLRIKTRRGRGRDAIIDGIKFENILMEEVITPLVINMYYDRCDPDGLSEYVYSKNPLPVDDRTPYLGEFHFKNIKATKSEVSAGFFYGLPEMPIKKIHLENIYVDFIEEVKPGHPAMMQHLDAMAKKGFYFNFVNEVVIENVTVKGQEGPAVEVHNEKSYVTK